jgi:hypothetical protein
MDSRKKMRYNSYQTTSLSARLRYGPTESVEAVPMTKTMVIEPVRAFNGLDVLVARHEGLFAAAGLEVQFASRQPGDLRSTAEGTLEHPVTSQGRLLERGEARMFQG